MSRSNYIEKYNDRLSSFNQNIRIEESNNGSLVLNNGMVLSDSEKTRFLRRIMSDNFVEHLDEIMSGNEEIVGRIKRGLCSLGGKKAQEKHGDQIRNNLNTGIPWNKNKTYSLVNPRSEESKKNYSLSKIGEKSYVWLSTYRRGKKSYI